MSSNPSGWYPDPSGKQQQRWWNGTDWTDFVSVNGQTFVDSGDAAPAAPVAPAAPAAPAVTAPTYAPTVPVGVAAPAVAVPVGRRSLTQRLAAIAAVSLVVGGVVGYVAGSGGDDQGGGGGASAGTLSAPLIEGMASLDTYEFRVSAVTIGPNSADRSEMTATGAADKAAELRHQTSTSTSTSADDPEPSTSTSESWMNADMSCSFDGEEYTSEAANPLGTDFGSLISGVFDIVIPSSNSQKAGDDTIAGIAADHYTFSIKGLGADSGWLVDTNQGEVWVAKDGGYVLKYVVNVSMRADAQSSEMYSLQLTLEFTSVNQPVSIQVPAACPAPTADTTG